MIQSITVNYGTRDFFGQYESHSDTYEVKSYDTSEKLVKIIDKVMRHVLKGDVYAHFNHDDGSSDCVHLGSYDRQDGTIELIHSESWNSKDSPVEVSAKEFKRRMKAELE